MRKPLDPREPSDGEMRGEVVLAERLRAALQRLNPALPPEAISPAADELVRDRSAMNRQAANLSLPINPFGLDSLGLQCGPGWQVALSCSCDPCMVCRDAILVVCPRVSVRGK